MDSRPKTALGLGINSYFPRLRDSRTSMGTGSGRDVPGILQLIHLASACAEYCLAASGAKTAIQGTQPFEEGATLNSACIPLDKSLHHPESLF